ncbi:MAG: ATP-binding cassette domain-containing protein [Bacteroidales bacterium]|nr:ATP-binding cassette domain-containing protein [Bacteroidales bacterium]MBR4215348.1 ATP-binding cassette domain-containing protein [Bacteroidales bacterium]
MLEEHNLVEYQNVTIERNGADLLKNISFSVSKGDFVTLEGVVGSGKSTLLRSIYADVPITQGRARVLDFELKGLPFRKVSKLRSQLGLVFQNYLLFDNKTVFDNLKFVLDSLDFKTDGNQRDYIMSVLQKTGLGDKAQVFPHNLSGGERQTVAIARALVHQPKLILADEPTGNLDQESAAHIADLLHQSVKSGAAVIVATHDEPVFAGLQHTGYKISGNDIVRL